MANQTTPVIQVRDSNVGIGTTTPYTKLSVVRDITTTAEFGSFGQFALHGLTDLNKILSFGFNTSDNVGFIQPMINGTSYNNLLLNARGGNVLIGTTTDAGYKLNVNGTSYFNGAGLFTNGVTITNNIVAGQATPLHLSYAASDGAGPAVRFGSSQGFWDIQPNSDNTRLFWEWSDSTNVLTLDATGKIGVGTTAPVNKIQIGSVGSSGYSGNDLAIGDGTSVFAVYMASNLTNLYTNKAFSFQASGAGATGNVLIGTTTDAGYKLDVNGSGRIAGQFIQGSGAARSTNGTTVALTYNTAYSANSDLGDGGRFLSIVNESTVTNAYSALSFRVNPDNAGGGSNAMVDMKFVNANSSNSSTLIWTFLSGGAWADRMALTSAGNVGIGTTSPGTPLGGALGLVIDGNANGDVQFRLQSNSTGRTSSDGGLLSISGTAMYLWNYENDATLFGTNNAERMRITAGGNVLIGTTTDTGGIKLQVAPSVSSWISGTFSGNGGTDKVVIGNYNGRASIGGHNSALNGWAALSINFDGGNVLIGTITDNGNKLRVEGTTWIAGNVFTNGEQGIELGWTGSTINDQRLGRIRPISTPSQNPYAGGLAFDYYKYDGSSYNWFEGMRLNGSGNLLIGTATDGGYKLDVNGNTRIQGNSYVTSRNYISLEGNLPVAYKIPYSQLAGGTVVSDNLANGGSAKAIYSSSTPGTFFFGPYSSIEPGSYVAKFRLKVASNASSSSIGAIDVAGTNIAGNSLLLRPSMFPTSGDYYYFSVPFTVGPAASGSLETRWLNWPAGVTDAYVDHVFIESAQSESEVYVPTSKDFNVYTDGTSKLVVKNNGNVGIGTTSPSTQLHISGTTTNITLTDTTFNRTSNIGYIDNANLYFANDAGSNTYIGRYNAVFLCYNGGNVVVGSSTDAGYKLDVHGEILGRDDIRIFNTYALILNGTDANWRIGRNTITDTGWLTGNTMQMVVFGGQTGQGFQVVNSNGTALFEIDGVAGASRFSNALGVGVNPSGTSGRIDASNDIVAYSTSDSRLKENITPIANALDKVKSLTGVEFDWKKETKDVHGYEGHDVGVIAQEVQAVLPEAIRTNDTGYLSVRYEKMIALLIEANKELAARVEELEKKLK
jgi:hypothetical protein